LPDDARIGAGQPLACRPSRTSLARARAAACSSSVEEMPDNLRGSRSTSKSVLRVMLWSAVLPSPLPTILVRLQARASRSGSTGFIVT